jgi:AMP nucleosidase
MQKRIYPEAIDTIARPEPVLRQSFTDAKEAVAALQKLYRRNTKFLRDSFSALGHGGATDTRYRAFYPEVGVSTVSYAQIDSRQAYGHMPTPGRFTTTITRPDLFETYLKEQLRLIIRNHGAPVFVGESETPIPIHFAFYDGQTVDGSVADNLKRPIRDLFDVPDLEGTDDHIANGTFEVMPGEARPLATVSRLSALTIRCIGSLTTRRRLPEHFQNFRAVHKLPVLHRRVLRLSPAT